MTMARQMEGKPEPAKAPAAVTVEPVPVSVEPVNDDPAEHKSAASKREAPPRFTKKDRQKAARKLRAKMGKPLLTLIGYGRSNTAAFVHERQEDVRAKAREVELAVGRRRAPTCPRSWHPLLPRSWP